MLAIVSGVLESVIFPLPSLYMLCWIAVAPLLVAVLHAREADTLQLSDSPGLKLVPANFGQGFLWVAVELARTRITGFPWDLLGAVQVDNIPLARIARFTGVYGLSFEIMLVNTALATAFLVRRDKRKMLLIAGLCAAVALQAGRWIAPPRRRADHTAYLVQPNIPILDSSAWTKDYFEGTLRDLLWISEKPTSEAAPKPDLIVWPESPAPFYTSDPLFRHAVSDLARQTHSWVLAGSIGVRNATQMPEEGTAAYNSGALVDPNGEWIGRYDKVHLVPFGEY